MFREFISGWMADTAEPAQLRAELMAASVVAAHNHVLRRWLRSESSDSVQEVDDALRLVISLFAGPSDTADGGSTIVVFRTTQDIGTLIPALQRLTGASPG